MGKIERKYMAHYIDASFGYVPGEDIIFSPDWYRLGEDLEEYNVELNAQAEIERNLLGNDIVITNGYEMSGEVETFYAYKGDVLFAKLQNIIDNAYEGKRCFTHACEVHLFIPKEMEIIEEGTTIDIISGYKAILRPCYVVPAGYGGDTSGYQIPFGIFYLNTFSTNGIFVPDGSGSGVFHGGDSGTFYST